jgi:hypothetical protein
MIQPKWMYRTLGSILFFSAAVLAWTLLGNRERVLLAGNFHSVAHKGTGEARVVALSDGRRMLRLLGVKTYPAPELEVCLVGAPDAEDNDTVLQSGLVCLGSYDPKAAYVSYPLPPPVDIGRYRAVAIWSRGYQVNFTTAPLGQ